MNDVVEKSAEAVSKSIEKVYTHFLLRDLVYLFSGGLVLTSSVFVVQGELVYSNVTLFFAAGYLLCSYFMGHIVQYIGMLFGMLIRW